MTEAIHADRDARAEGGGAGSNGGSIAIGGGAGDGGITRDGSGERHGVSGETAAILSMIERAARDPNVDIDKMERLFGMHEKVEHRRAVQAYNAAMALAQAEMPAVVKNKKNTHTGNKYADLYAIADDCLPIIHSHGFGLSFSECPATKPDCMGVSCRVSHRDGHSETYSFNIPIDATGAAGKVNKTQTQAYGSTYTYGRRYATCGVFNVIITDSDGNSVRHETKTISQEQEDRIRDAIEAGGRNLLKFCEYFRIEKLSDLPADKFDGAIKLIGGKRNA